MSIWSSASVFFQNVFSRERVNLWFFVTFNIIISYIFPENFVKFTPLFLSIFRVFWHFFVTKWRQHTTDGISIFFTFNLLLIGCFALVWSYIDTRLVFLEILIKGGGRGGEVGRKHYSTLKEPSPTRYYTFP